MAIPFIGFIHQDTFDIPQYPYNLTVRQTIQPPHPPSSDEFSYILDLDVFTTRPVELAENEVHDRLSEMRWIKNRAFYSYLKPEAISKLKE